MASERLQVILEMLTGQYKAQAAQAATATSAVGASAKTATAQTAGLGGGLKKLSGAGGLLAVVGGAAAVKGALGGTVGAFASFDDAMNQSLAIMGNVSEEMRGRMSDAAREVGRTTTFSAEEAAESYFFLASAGLDAAQSIEAMPAVAKFAQAGMFDMALATDLVTDAQSALGLSSDDAAQHLENLTRVTDVFVKANILANTSVQQVSEAMTNKAGAALRALGKDVEEGAAVLAAFADQGTKGAEAGTQFSIVLRDLQTKALANKSAFEEAGVAVFDAAGEMRNIADIIGDLENALAGMSDAEKKSTLLGLGFSDKSVAAITTLLGTSDAIREYEAALRDAGGTTAEIAGKQLESATKQWELFKSQIADAGLLLGEMMLPTLGDVTEELLLMTGASTRAEIAFRNLVREGRGSADSADTFADALTHAAVAMNDFWGAGATPEIFRNELDALWGSMELGRGEIQRLANMTVDTLMHNLKLTADQAEYLAGFFDNELAASLDTLETSFRDGAEPIMRYNEVAGEATTAADELGAATGDLGTAVYDADGELTGFIPTVDDIADSTDDAAAAVRDLTNAYLEAANPIFAAQSALDRYREAQDTLSEVQKDDESTAEDIANAQLDVASAALEAEQALLGLGDGNVWKGISAIADALNISDEEARDLLETLGLIDGTTVTTVVETQYTYSGSPPPYNPGGNYTPRHSGGPVEAGRAYNWKPGEEMFIPTQDGMVTSKQDTDRILAAMGVMAAGSVTKTGPTINLNGPVNGVDEVMAAVQRASGMVSMVDLAEVNPR